MGVQRLTGFCSSAKSDTLFRSSLHHYRHMGQVKFSFGFNWEEL